METYKKTKKLAIKLASVQQQYDNFDLKNNKRSYRKYCFNSILIYHEITYDTAMKKTPPSPFLPFWKARGATSLLTAISTHCLAALPAKMTVFNSHKRTLDLLPCYCYTIKTNRRTIRSQVFLPACAGKRAAPDLGGSQGARAPHHVHVFSHMYNMCVPLCYFY